jgi:hypothetical protein
MGHVLEGLEGPTRKLGDDEVNRILEQHSLPRCWSCRRLDLSCVFEQLEMSKEQENNSQQMLESELDQLSLAEAPERCQGLFSLDKAHCRSWSSSGSSPAWT